MILFFVLIYRFRY